MLFKVVIFYVKTCYDENSSNLCVALSSFIYFLDLVSISKIAIILLYPGTMWTWCYFLIEDYHFMDEIWITILFLAYNSLSKVNSLVCNSRMW